MNAEMLLYRRAASSGRMIAELLGINHERVGRGPNYICINWGCGTDRLVPRAPVHWINKRNAVQVAQDKRETIRALKTHGVNVPEFTTSYAVAEEWVSNGETVYCRTMLKASQGRGIIVARNREELVNAPLYTKGVSFNRSREYRVHVCNGKVIAAARKVIGEQFDDDIQLNYMVRSHNNGWTFRKCVVPRVHAGIKNEAIKAISALGLDFGAVDLIWNFPTETATVLEVNTAPGVEGSTLDAYVTALRRLINQISGVPDINVFKIAYTEYIPTPKELEIRADSADEARQIFTEMMDGGDETYTINNVFSDRVERTFRGGLAVSMDRLRELRRELEDYDDGEE